MIKKTITVELATSVDARPIALLVQVASQFDSEIHLETPGKRVNAKSIMGMMALGLDNGEAVTIIANGTDEEQAMLNVENYLTNK